MPSHDRVEKAEKHQQSHRITLLRTNAGKSVQIYSSFTNSHRRLTDVKDHVEAVTASLLPHVIMISEVVVRGNVF